MTDCEICGAPATKKVKIDGIILDVCDECAKLGETVSISLKKPKKKIKDIEELDVFIDPEYPKIIKDARESRGLSIDDVAHEIREKRNVLSKIERGDLQPTLELARKIEKFFGVKIIVESVQKFKDQKLRKSEEYSLTIGDVVEIKNDQSL
ncbi:MAG: TIGR00270 family protein [Candidatus Aenigmarchaeota archaeon]|nr:TIGR00270 family protein [Candidatus Aenigmarchaeota archaeon]